MTTTYPATTVWVVVLAIGVLTFAIRFSFIALFGVLDRRSGDDESDQAVPPRVAAALRYVPPAVLAALVFPAVVTVEPTVAETLSNERLLAGGAAAAVAWRTENVLATIAVGMAVLWTLQFLV
ncbi:branched-chain amino acid ABC transporter permease [Haloprofundus marisrubri]|uniref:Branched-chain amino acid ABC transporter permease n=1 Tax=Haloprofundus marisrubri TaxID=1514971 RepID=A0A0W1R6V9_9EURY|nr:AzlD domain-containing protein [Haloprofundus marisrubri]KTG09113.1 branched-chain amino acid ABC transporter permease [Haloprofundus marisrubri]